MALRALEVSQVNRYISRVISTDPILNSILVNGEISNLKYHNSGHLYFSLKDEQSILRCFMPSSYVSKLRYRLTDGMKVIAAGNINVYERGGIYSLNVRSVEISGTGDLAIAFKEMYEKLKSEGLFNIENKKNIPIFPEKVCIITSETGAALQDILKIIRSRNNYTDVLIYPCQVQGEYAASYIATSIKDVNEKFPDIDIIILARGGGSIEDLWAFNEEIVARSIFESEIPIISAVGHETDFTISDYASDLRAETPTAAAVICVPDINSIRKSLFEMKNKLRGNISDCISSGEMAIKFYEPCILGKTIENRRIIYENHCNSMKNIMVKDISHKLERLNLSLEKQEARLNIASPEKILKKGYAIVRSSDDNRILGSINEIHQVSSGLILQMKDGNIELRKEK